MLIGNFSALNKSIATLTGHAYLSLHPDDLARLIYGGSFGNTTGYPNGSGEKALFIAYKPNGLSCYMKAEVSQLANLSWGNIFSNIELTSSCSGELGGLVNISAAVSADMNISVDLLHLSQIGASLSFSAGLLPVSIEHNIFPTIDGYAIPSAQQIADAVWSNAVRSLTVGGPDTTMTLADIATAIWTRPVRTTTDPVGEVPAVPTATEIANAVWSSTIRKLSTSGNKDIASAIAAYGYDTDVLNSQLIQLDENGVEVCRFNCFGDQGLPTLVNIKKMVKVTPV